MCVSFPFSVVICFILSLNPLERKIVFHYSRTKTMLPDDFVCETIFYLIHLHYWVSFAKRWSDILSIVFSKVE
ncbi:hypothetical protein GLYMA_06G008600v4 [Glycine max]|uniref:Uncharacterized protein n=1 Tax=Glycine max TaxID=3847 RepID=K7KSE1_SOYBN|nr:hypothetical protein GYH30_013705 [Glycine max]KRH51469.1 hypothetical protein GLYMA_06G008600v4 [Glycine max]